MTTRKFSVEIVPDEDEDSQCEYSSVAHTVESAVAYALQTAFEQGFKQGSAKAREKDYSPYVGPFFEEENVNISISIDYSEYSCSKFKRLLGIFEDPVDESTDGGDSE